MTDHVILPRDRKAACGATSAAWIDTPAREKYTREATTGMGRAFDDELDAWAQTFADHASVERDLLEAVLLFFKGGAWTARDQEDWRRLVGDGPATNFALCERIREVLGKPPRKGETR